jgi:hypothetical protein
VLNVIETRFNRERERILARARAKNVETPLSGIVDEETMIARFRQEAEEYAKSLGLKDVNDITFKQFKAYVLDTTRTVAPTEVRLGKMSVEAQSILTDVIETPSQVFTRLWTDMMNSPDGQFVADVIGPSMAQMVDPGQLRVQLRTLNGRVDAKVPGAAEARRNFLLNVVHPWARNIDPSIRAGSADAAARVLKSRVASSARNTVLANANPFNPSASKRTITRWFDELFDTADAAPIIDVASAGSRGVVVPRRRGILAKQAQRYQDMEGFFAAFDDPFVSPSEIFATGRATGDTPSWYGLQLQHLADDLDGVVSQASYNPKGLWRQSANQRVEVAKANVRGAKATGLVQAMEGVGDAAGVKLTKAQQATRDAILEHRNFLSSSWYAPAKQDEDIIRFLRAAAGINMSVFDDGIVVGVSRVPRYTYKVKPQEMSSFVDARVEKRMVAREAERQKAIISRGLTEDFADEDVVALRAQLEEIDRGVEEQFRQIDARAAEGNQQAVREARKLSEIEGPDSYDEIPRFFEYEEIVDGQPVRTKLVFSQEEWDSLYTRPARFADIRSAEARIPQLQKEKASLGRQIQKDSTQFLTPRKQELATIQDSIDNLSAVGAPGPRPSRPQMFVGDASTSESRRRWAAQRRGLDYNRVENKRVLDAVYTEEARSAMAEYRSQVRRWQQATSEYKPRVAALKQLTERRRVLMREVVELETNIGYYKSRLGAVVAEEQKIVSFLKTNDPNVRKAALYKVQKLIIGPDGSEADWFDTLTQEFHMIKNYKEAWKSAPFPPTFKIGRAHV